MIHVYGQYRSIKCEDPKCGWSSGCIPPKCFEKWINKGCPVCAKKVLTRDQYIAYVNKYAFEMRPAIRIHTK